MSKDRHFTGKQYYATVKQIFLVGVKRCWTK